VSQPFQLAIVFKKVAVNILLQRYKTDDSHFATHQYFMLDVPVFFAHEITGRARLFF
jgi:hypothetical protein